MKKKIQQVGKLELKKTIITPLTAKQLSGIYGGDATVKGTTKKEPPPLPPPPTITSGIVCTSR